MQKPYDGKIYLIFGAAALFLCLLLSGISAWSTFSVEPEIKKYLNSDASADLEKAWKLLENPQIFAGYDHFDPDSAGISGLLSFFRRLSDEGGEFKPEHRQYLNFLLERRESGTVLGYKTAVFLFAVSCLAFGMYILERRTSGKQLKKK